MCICSRATYSGVEPAMQWVLEHMADPGVYICYTMSCIRMMCYKKHDFFFQISHCHLSLLNQHQEEQLGQEEEEEEGAELVPPLLRKTLPW